MFERVQIKEENMVYIEAITQAVAEAAIGEPKSTVLAIKEEGRRQYTRIMQNDATETLKHRTIPFQ